MTFGVPQESILGPTLYWHYSSLQFVISFIYRRHSTLCYNHKVSRAWRDWHMDKCGNTSTQASSKIRNLGVTMDQTMSIQPHVSSSSQVLIISWETLLAYASTLTSITIKRLFMRQAYRVLTMQIFLRMDFLLKQPMFCDVCKTVQLDWQCVRDIDITWLMCYANYTLATFRVTSKL